MDRDRKHVATVAAQLTASASRFTGFPPKRGHARARIDQRAALSAPEPTACHP